MVTRSYAPIVLYNTPELYTLTYCIPSTYNEAFKTSYLLPTVISANLGGKSESIFGANSTAS